MWFKKITPRPDYVIRVQDKIDLYPDLSPLERQVEFFKCLNGGITDEKYQLLAEIHHKKALQANNIN